MGNIYIVVSLMLLLLFVKLVCPAGRRLPASGGRGDSAFLVWVASEPKLVDKVARVEKEGPDGTIFRQSHVSNRMLDFSSINTSRLLRQRSNCFLATS
jgi:hypothetical protein